MKTCLNLGCGKDIRRNTNEEKWVNMDVSKLPGVDVVHNVNKCPWPFKVNTFDEIYASHVLEHVDNLIKCLEEIYRISKNDAKIIVKVPFFPSIYAMTDPTHKHFFTYFTFDYFRSGEHYSYYSKAKFEIIKKKIVFSWNRYLKWMDFFVNLHPKFYSRYLSFILPSNELEFELNIVK